MSAPIKHKFVAVEGPIGVGKTTLARQLAEALGYGLLCDSETENPYLEKFYRNPAQFALHAQIHFLLSRVAGMEAVASAQSQSAEGVVADFFLDKDRLFAATTLDEQEFLLYEGVHSRVASGYADPDLVIYLQAPVEVLIKRIEKRGLAFDQRIDSSYLRRLADQYESYFHQYDRSPLLVVNAAEINLADNPRDFENLLHNISEIGAGRHYLNPIAETV